MNSNSPWACIIIFCTKGGPTCIAFAKVLNPKYFCLLKIFIICSTSACLLESLKVVSH